MKMNSTWPHELSKLSLNVDLTQLVPYNSGDQRWEVSAPLIMVLQFCGLGSPS